MNGSRLPWRRIRRMLLGVALCLAGGFAPARADDPPRPPDESRREFRTPGLVVETGARTASCDVLLFTKDGKQLLAAGDDKVVRTWDVTEQGLRKPLEHAPVLRWPSYRETFGNIRAMALSPKEDAIVVVGQGGWYSDGFEVAVINRKTGDLTHVLSPDREELHKRRPDQLEYVTSLWSVAFSPSGNRVALGTANGGVWLWQLTDKDLVLLGHHGGRRKDAAGRFDRLDRVVFLTFDGEDRLVSINCRGEMLQWSLLAREQPKRLLDFNRPVASVTTSPDRTRIAAVLEALPNQQDIVQLVTLADPNGQGPQLAVPPAGNRQEFLHRAAFSADGRTVAVATRWVGLPELPEPAPTDQDTATIVAVVPVDAKVTIDGAATGKTGSKRPFTTASLQRGSTYSHEIVASWTENGKTVQKRRTVYFRAGETKHVDFLQDRVDFFQELGGQIWLFDLAAPAAPPRPGPQQSLHAECLAFHPATPSRLAIAGGDDHEVQLWDVSGRAPERIGSPIHSPGHGLWGVKFDAKGRYIAFQQERNPRAPHPNQRGQGPWRYFDLKHGRNGEDPFRFVDADEALTTFAEPPDAAAGWRIRFRRAGAPGDPARWYVEGPKLDPTPLQWDEAADEFPRCYAFVPSNAKTGQPRRLLVGHYWGVSVFDLPEGGANVKEIRRTRLLRGHEGYVTALSVSPDGCKLVTVSRDQTIAGWRLDDWPAHAILGASFAPREKSLFVDKVNAGSPAWEIGLSPQDEIIAVAMRTKNGPAWVYGTPEAKVDRNDSDARAVAARLAPPQHGDAPSPPDALNPGDALGFKWRRAGERDVHEQYVRLVDRPIWRMFPTDGDGWVMWRYWDYYYASKHNGDFNIGWQRSEPLATKIKPEFIRAEQEREKYHDPKAVARTVDGWTNDALAWKLRDMPPVVTVVDAAGQAARGIIPMTDKDGPVELRVRITLRGTRDIEKPTPTKALLVWINDFQQEAIDLDKLKRTPEGYEYPLTVNKTQLRTGPNQLVAQCNSRGLGRGDSEPITIELRRAAPVPKLFGLLVGVSNYSKADPPQPPLRAREDAEALKKAWEAQQGKRYQSVALRTLYDHQATRAAIRSTFAELRNKVQPDDVFLLYLGGHGTSETQLREKVKLLPKHLLGIHGFRFCCPNMDFNRLTDTTVGFDELYEDLVKLPCHKLVLLDACHAGAAALAVTEDEAPIRILTKHSIGPVILAACRPNERALESPAFDLGNTYGLFSASIRRMLRYKDDFDEADIDGDGTLTSQEMQHGVETWMKWLLDEHARERGLTGGGTRVHQTPQAHIPSFEEKLGLVSWGK